MPSTEDYLNAIRSARESKRRVKIDFDSLPEGVDGAQVMSELGQGLPAEYAEGIHSARINRRAVTLTYSAIPETPTMAQRAGDAASSVIGPIARAIQGAKTSVTEALPGIKAGAIGMGTFGLSEAPAYLQQEAQAKERLANQIQEQYILPAREALRQYAPVERGPQTPGRIAVRGLGETAIQAAEAAGGMVPTVPTEIVTAAAFGKGIGMAAGKFADTFPAAYNVLTKVPVLNVMPVEIQSLVQSLRYRINRALGIPMETALTSQDVSVLSQAISKNSEVSQEAKALRASLQANGISARDIIEADDRLRDFERMRRGLKPESPGTRPPEAPAVAPSPIAAPKPSEPPPASPRAPQAVPGPVAEVPGKPAPAPEAKVVLPPIETPTAKPIKPKKAPKSEVISQDAKDRALAQLDAAIAAAPEPEGPRATYLVGKEPMVESVPESKGLKGKAGVDYIEVKIDGGYKVVNTKAALTEFRTLLSRLPLTLTEPKVGAKKSLAQTRLTESYEPLIPIKGGTGYFTDGKMLVKGTPPARTPFTDTRSTDMKALQQQLKGDTTPLQKLYYYLDTPGATGVSDQPIRTDQREAMVAFRSGDKYIVVQQRYIHAIESRHPGVEFGLADKNGRIIARVGKEPVGAVMAYRGGPGKGEVIMQEPPLAFDAVEMGFLPIEWRTIYQIPANLADDVTPPTVPVQETPPEPTMEPAPTAGASGLSAQQWGVTMPPEPTPTAAKTGYTVSKVEMLDWLERAFGAPIRDALTHRMVKRAGHYENYNEIIRLKKWGEIEVAAHEIGHHIDKTAGKKHGVLWRKNIVPKADLKSAISELAALDYNPKLRRTSEGFAEYIRHTTTIGDGEAVAPTFHKHFMAFLEHEPQLKANLTEFTRLYTTWREQGALNRVLSQVDFQGELTPTATLSERAKEAVEWFKRRWVDSLRPFQEMEEKIAGQHVKGIDPAMSPFQLATYYKRKAGAVARTWVIESAIDRGGNPVGPSLSQIMAPIPAGQYKEFVAYAVARRAQVYAVRGLESGFDINDANYLSLKYDNPVWRATSDALSKWSDQLLEHWLIPTGGISRDVYEACKALNPFYLRMKRILVDGEMGAGGAGTVFREGMPVKRLKGGARPIMDPLQAMIEYAQQVIQSGMVIDVGRAAVTLAQSKGPAGARYIVEIPAPLKAESFKVGTLLDALKGVGVDVDKLDDVDVDELATIFSKGAYYKTTRPIVTHFVKGERKYYELDPKLWDALMSVPPLKLWPVMSLLRPFARLLRLTTVQLSPAFGLIKNIWRDALDYQMYSKRTTATVFDPLLGIYKDLVTGPGEPAWRYKVAGGAVSTQMGYDRAAIMHVHDEMLIKSKGLAGKALYVVKHPVDALRELINVGEMGPRISEVEGMLAQNRRAHPDWSEFGNWVQTFNDAQDVTINFTRAGSYAAQVNEGAAFFTAGMGGWSKMVREIKGNPARLFLRGMATLTPLALLMWYRNKDKQWYKNLHPAYKFGNIFIDMPNGVFRLPIPFEMGTIFMSLPVMLAESEYNHRKPEYDGIMQVIENQVPNPTPTMLQPWVDVATNRDYLGRPIESEGMKRLPTSERRHSYTTAVAYALSAGAATVGVKLSPVQMDYLLWNFTGGLPYEVGLMGHSDEYPVLRRVMVQSPYIPRRQMDDYFRTMKDLEQRHNSHQLTPQEEARYKTITRYQGKAIGPRLKIIRDIQDHATPRMLEAEYENLRKQLAQIGFE